ncbi:hypothetical protein GOODEAATRI_034647 [Goodea atripinnis]|uniref:Uncharacterized protein n=1 Tax=Goodea atripinnis TaxID=208336 RepID=A0ABV0MXH5_9TELE
MAAEPGAMGPDLGTQKAMAVLVGHCSRMGYPVGRTSSVLAGVFLAVAAGVSPRVSRVQQVMEGQVAVQQQRLELEAEVSLWRVLVWMAEAQKAEVIRVLGHDDSRRLSFFGTCSKGKWSHDMSRFL